MRANFTPQPHPAICDALRAYIVGELQRLLTAHGASEALGSAPRRIEILRANVRADLNRVAETTTDLLAHNGRVREVCGLLLATLDRPRIAMTDEERFRRETALEGQINDLQALELTHAMDRASHARLIAALHEYQQLLADWIAVEESRHYAPSATVAA